MVEDGSHIDEKTKVPLFAVVISIPFIFGGMLWLTSIDSKASQAKEQLQDAQVQMNAIRTTLDDVRDRVIRIEEKVKKR